MVSLCSLIRLIGVCADRDQPEFLCSRSDSRHLEVHVATAGGWLTRYRPREVRNSIYRYRKIHIDYRSKFLYRFISPISIIYGNTNKKGGQYSMSHWKIGVKILCSKSWEGQNSMKAKIRGSKFYFFLVEPLVKILCSLKRGVKILYFFPVPWKRGVKTAEPTNQLHWRGAPPGQTVSYWQAVNLGLKKKCTHKFATSLCFLVSVIVHKSLWMEEKQWRHGF